MGILRRARDTFNSARLHFRAARRNRKLAAAINPAEVDHLQPSYACAKTWYGSPYGGFYVCPDRVPIGAIVYSIGIGKDITFDLAMLNAHDCKIFAFDPTPKAIHYLEDKMPARAFDFFPYGITAGESGPVTFYLPTDRNATSGSLLQTSVMSAERAIEVDMKNFADITGSLGHSHIDVLKIDIEGAEYEVMEDIMHSDVTIDQILLEFHDRMFDTPTFRSRATVELLQRHGYQIFASSETFEEVSFIKAGEF